MKPRRSGSAGAVRIIGGEWRGTRLPVADLDGLRPTADRVRETLFNWLQPRIAGARVLDLFAGSGALGFEAASRGAREVFLVEREPGTVRTLRDSADRLKAGERVHIVQADALAWLQAPLHGRFDLVFVDPPFDAELWPRVLERVPPWLADDAWLYLETPAQGATAPGLAWQPHREGHTREVRYGLYRRVRPVGEAVTLAPDPTPTAPIPEA